jgi:sugar phosphate isomerase/epimerase
MQVLDCAAANGYAAVELRSLAGTEDLASRPEFAPGRIEETRRQLATRGLRVASVDSSTQLHVSDARKRELQLEDGRRFIALASRLGAPYVRVFGDQYPEGEPRERVLDRVALGLRQLGEEAGRHGVTVLLETHGDFTDSPSLRSLLRRAHSPHVGILWDAHHTYVEGHEEPAETFRQLGPYIRHTHLKDSVPDGEGRRYVLTGEGTVPVRDQVQLLLRSGYRGAYSFEWEKRWQPELEEPEVAIPQFARVVREYASEI